MPRNKSKRKKRCYLCQQRVPIKAFTKYNFDILQCPHCSLYSLKFQQNYQSFINHYYTEEFFTGSNDRIGYSDYEGDSLAESINMKRYLVRLMHHKKRGRLLDVGCATGIFLQAAKNIGFSPYGFDVSAYAIKKAKQKFGNRVRKTTVAKARYQKNFFDLITMFDVVEHLENPRQDLLNIRQYLKDNGILVINTGDAGSLLAKIQGKHWHFFVPPQHLFFFSRNTLTQLLHQAGFKVVKINYKGKWVSIRYFLNLYRQIHHNKLADSLYQLVSQNRLGTLPLYLNLFDNIIVYAKKDPHFNPKSS